MCIICAKAKGVDMPTKDTISNMWNRNPHGAGFMYAKDGKVLIRKGFMTLADLTAALEEAGKDTDLKKTGVVLHFRITTHGGTCPANTHPFSITDNVKRLQMSRVATDVGVAHNGIIHNTPRSKDISDTMEYIASVLAPMKRSNPCFYTDNNLLDLITNTIDGSRMCFLNGDGDIVTVGSTWTEEGGIKYSNTSYKGYNYRHYTSYPTAKWWSYDDDYDTGFEVKSKSKSSKKKSKKKSGKGSLTIVDRKPIMWVGMTGSGAFITTDTNTCIEGEDFGIDRNGWVYQYDKASDAFYYCEGYRAWDEHSLNLKFKDELASNEVIITHN